MAVFRLGMIAGVAASGGLEIPHDQRQYQIVLLVRYQDRIEQGKRCSRSPNPWTTSGPLSPGLSRHDLPRQYFLGHSGHMVEPT